jgi:signal transduction histidine kinase
MSDRAKSPKKYWKIKNRIIISMVLLVLAVFSINFYIIKTVLFKEFSNELLGRYYSRTKQYANQVQDSVFLKREDQVTSIIFEGKWSRSDVAYILVNDSSGRMIANTFIGDIPFNLQRLHTLETGQTEDMKLVDISDVDYYDVAVRLNYGQGIMRVGFYKTSIDTVMSNAMNLLAASVAIPLIIGILMAIVISIYILRPINSLKAQILAISQKGSNDMVVISSNDEVGELALAFNEMTEKLKRSQSDLEAYSRSLEKMVKEKTVEMRRVLSSTQKDRDDLEQQRVAMMNILEDTQEAQDKLSTANAILEKNRMELEALKALSEELQGALGVEESLVIVERYLEIGYKYDAVTFLIPGESVDDLIFWSDLNRQANESVFVKIKSDLRGFITSNKSDMGQVLKVIDAVNPKITGMKPNNKLIIRSVDSHVFPIKAGDKVSGMMALSSFEKKLDLSEQELRFINAVVSTLSVSIARLELLNAAQQSKTESLVRSLSDGVVMFDQDQRPILSNPAIGLLTNGNQAQSFTFLQAFVPDLKDHIGKMMKNGTVENLNEVAIKDKYFQIFLTPVKERENVVGGAVILHDITHLKEIDKMKSEFVSVASHQLRTPLTAIKLFTEMLVSGQVGDLTKDQKEYLNNVYQSTERMARLVNDLLSLSRLESGRLRIDPEPTKLEDLIDSVVNEAEPLAKLKNCSIEFDRPKKTMPKVTIDANMVRQVIHNLITNAIRYSDPEKGIVRVAVRLDSREYEIGVADNGIGIADKDKARIFEKFFRTDNAVKKETDGSGLGLYVSKMIVETTGGRIWFDSKEGQGSKFSFTIPKDGMKKKEGDKTLESGGS